MLALVVPQIFVPLCLWFPSQRFRCTNLLNITSLTTKWRIGYIVRNEYLRTVCVCYVCT